MNTILQIYRKAYAHRKSIFLIGKIFIAALLIFAIYQHLFVKSDFDELKTIFKQKITESNPIYIIIPILLMPINWILESLKWQSLLNSFQKISFLKSVYSVLTGTCLAIITPGRLGEYGGRLFYIEEGNRLLAVRSTFVGSIIQNVINTSIGFLCLFLLQQKLQIVSQDDINILGILNTGVFIILLIIYIVRKPIIRFLVKRFHGYKDRIRSFFDLSGYSKKQLFNATLFSFLRYVVYVVQYMFIIQFFDVTDDMYSSILGVGVIYLFQTLLPLPPILSIFARGEIAVVIWSYFSHGVLGILAATFSLWLINLMIPALLGYFLLLKIKG